MFLVGLTGGIACGKSTAAEMLVSLGCPLIDADVVARQVVEPGEPAWKKIKATFGSEVFQEDGNLDRAKLANIIFADEGKRKLLNSITHPEIYKTMMKKVLYYFLTGKQFVVLDLPLLFETGKMVPYMSYILVVSCDEKSQLDRLMLRNNYTSEEARQGICSQMPVADKCRQATHIIDNSSSLDNTRQQVQTIYEEISRSKKHWRLRIILGGFLLSIFSLGIWVGTSMAIGN